VNKYADDMGEFYIAGVDQSKFNTSFDFPFQLRTAAAQRGFTGCIKVKRIDQCSILLDI